MVGGELFSIIIVHHAILLFGSRTVGTLKKSRRGRSCFLRLIFVCLVDSLSNQHMSTKSLASDLVLPTNLATVAEFEQWQQRPGNDGNFEFVRGRIIPKSMKQIELDIAAFLQSQFLTTDVARQKHLLMPEVDAYVDGFRKRIPDLTYFTAEQRKAIRRGERVNTLFAIEILSDSETYEDVLDKIQDYFDGGAQLVWYIAPKREKIYAYTSPDESTVFKGLQTITAAPVIPGFQFVVADLFADASLL